MKLIKPSVQIIEQTNIAKHIELCGRVAYKSEDKITDISAYDFVKMLVSRKHTAVLEHGTVYLTIPKSDDYMDSVRFYKINPYTKVLETKDRFLITTNCRVMMENNRQEDTNKYEVPEPDGHALRHTVKFVIDRGVSHEFVRHRVMSFVQESTRFVNYSKDGKHQHCTFIIPNWIDELEECIYDDTAFNVSGGVAIWLSAMHRAEIDYNMLISEGWKPQQARSVLPNSTKTELIMTGFEDQWEHFFSLRCAPDAHPQAREVALQLQEMKNW